jgi:hypothetical protein
MNTKRKLFLLCPVPEDQKPMKEYMIIRENSWLTFFANQNYQSKFLGYFSTFTTVLFGFKLLTAKQVSSPVDLFFQTFFQVSFFFFFLLCIAFFRWRDVQTRLNQARLVYEESSWYDGQIWEKPLFLIKNDRLLTSQKILPIQRRIQNALGSFFFLLFLVSVISSQ